ncbi:MAG: infB [Candidatus Berkelbacteria bacterium]|nr:infB [Candidatus Berkelbacteria bacterium]
MGMARRRVRKLSKKEAKAAFKEGVKRQERESVVKTEQKAEKLGLEVPSVLTVREFAVILKLSVTEVIGTLVKNGVMATINESIDFDTMAIIGDELGYNIKLKIENTNIQIEKTPTKKKLKPRRSRENQITRCHPFD